MKLADVLATLRAAEPSLRPHGVLHAGVFGSLARGDARDESDIDIVVDLDPSISKTLWDYAGVQRVVSELFEGPVDVVDREALRPFVREDVDRDAVYAF